MQLQRLNFPLEKWVQGHIHNDSWQQSVFRLNACKLANEWHSILHTTDIHLLQGLMLLHITFDDEVHTIK